MFVRAVQLHLFQHIMGFHIHLKQERMVWSVHVEDCAVALWVG